MAKSEVVILTEQFFRRSGVTRSDIRTIRSIIDELGINCGLLDTQIVSLVDEVCASSSWGRATDAEAMAATEERLLTIGEFLLVFHKIKNAHHRQVTAKNRDVAEAFISVGGDDDLGGSVSAAIVKRRIAEFALRVDIDRLLDEVDEDQSGTVEYGEFETLMLNMHGSDAADDTVDTATLFTAFGGDPEDPHSTIHVDRAANALDSLLVTDEERVVIAGTLAYLKEHGPRRLDFDTFLAYFCDAAAFVEPLPRSRHDTNESSLRDAPMISRDHLQMKRYTVAAFQWAVRSNAQVALEPSAWLKARLARVWSIFQARAGRSAFPLGLVHLINLNPDVLLRGAERNRYGGHFLWSVVAKAANLLKEHGYKASRGPSDLAAIKSRTFAQRHAQAQIPAYARDTEGHRRFPPRPLLPKPPETSPHAAQHLADVRSRHKPLETTDDVVRSIFRAQLRHQRRNKRGQRM